MLLVITVETLIVNIHLDRVKDVSDFDNNDYPVRFVETMILNHFASVNESLYLNSRAVLYKPTTDVAT